MMGLHQHFAGIFGSTGGLFEEFGSARIVDPPISETGFIGAGIGAAVEGMRPVVELMFVDFFGVCFDQIYNHMAKIHYESGGNVKVPMVIMTALAAREFGGQRLGLLAGGLAAIYPNIWSWDGTILSEILAMLLLSTTIYLVYRFWNAPSRGGAALMGVSLSLAACFDLRRRRGRPVNLPRAFVLTTAVDHKQRHAQKHKHEHQRQQQPLSP